jgi:SAM-dependent methyltransferase
MSSESEDLKVLYANRFADAEKQRTDMWKVLCENWFQRWVPKDAVVLDIAAGHCEFINNIEAGTKLAIDLNPELEARAAADVTTYLTRSDDMPDIESGSVDRVFISNFFEHIPREVIVSTLIEAKRVLKPTGKLLLLQPNVRYCARDYWMFFDHITPVDDRAMEEAFASTGYDVETSIPRFLPYTTKGNTPSGPGLVKLYLKVPLAWRFMGAQAFMVATPKAGS